MPESINILLPFGYEEPTEADVRKGKNYVLRRESAARGLSSLIDALLKDAAEKIITLCYQFNIDPKKFKLTEKYNPRLFELVSNILDELEDEILDLVLDYSTRCTESEKRRSVLMPWILLLGRNNRNLQQPLDTRIWIFSRDMEAAVVAMMMGGHTLQKAITRVKSNIHALYNMPEMKEAFKQSMDVMATYIKTKGIKHGNIGNSNSEANNILRFGKTTVQMSWMRNLHMNYEDNGAEGYMVFRGSSYDCPLCDSYCNIFHPIEDTKSMPPYHPSCCCWTIPIFKTQT